MSQIATAEWHGPVPNVGHGARAVRLVVIHVMAGTLEGSDSWFHNPAADVSADVGTGKDGRLWQWVDPAQEIAWAEANYNSLAISIENEGQSGDQLTAAQIARCGEVLAWAHRVYGVPLAIATDPNGSGVIGHGQLGAAGGNHPDCPGQSILDQFPQIIAAAQGSSPQEDDMPKAFVCEDPATGGTWAVLTDDGEVDTADGAPYLGGNNSHPEWGSMDAAHPIVGIAPWKDPQGQWGYKIGEYDPTPPAGQGRVRYYRFPRNGSLRTVTPSA